MEKHLVETSALYYSGVPSDAYFADTFTTADLKKLVPIILLLILTVLFLRFHTYEGVLYPSLVVLLSLVWVVRTEVEPALEEESDFVRKMREEARARGQNPATIKNKYIMRLDLR